MLTSYCGNPYAMRYQSLRRVHLFFKMATTVKSFPIDRESYPFLPLELQVPMPNRSVNFPYQLVKLGKLTPR